ncbi:aspartyl/asparaginyl beta-hydroxylase-like isoform X10 [Xiphophorus hellerii]|uniref:aspartyl/asparaginyl beta-hydroxylase-like isoform X6 n=1 Tax=Xiphophorus hellerii TaxID=8084 RepID=UPI0013B45FD9|nr:aspartyl/asparaginyl beta-hydroxylase-like isoform X6 [Xiphophorus hellerii]XP_032407842.1 aspartyl/asparaginyl beta-hydroxylase-like isoform X10 [Xiphophorus hellerii]
MQRCASSQPLVEEIQAEEEEEEEEQEVFQETGGVNEEQVGPVEEASAQEPDGRPAPVEHKNGKRAEAGPGVADGGPRFSMFTWLMVVALLGVWSSVAVFYFDIVDYDRVLARAQEFRMNFSEVLQGKLAAYDTDGDGDFDVEDAKVLLEKTSKPEVETPTQRAPEPEEDGPGAEETSVPGSQDVESEIQAAVPLPPLDDSHFVPDDPTEPGQRYEEEPGSIDTTGVLVEENQPEETEGESGRYQTSSKLSQEAEAEKPPKAEPEPEPQTGSTRPTESRQAADGAAEKTAEEQKEKLKKKKPKLLNKVDKSIKSEIDAAERLRKKGNLDLALKAFDSLVQQHPLSPRARYGKAQVQDDLAEKLRSNDLLQSAISMYGEAAELPDVTSDLLRAALKRRAERQQFLGRMRGSLATLQKLVDVFPDDVGLRNDLGVAHLLLGDNKGAKKVYEEVLAVAPSNGFAKVHYGFILKAENKIAESIPYLREGLESGEPGTDDGRFYFHLGDALQRVGDDSAYLWYERGHQRGHFASVWQRSLYNVEGLKAQPWWTPQETGYADLVRMLERNWKTIRDEALAVMDRSRGRFLPEEENLREKGEWGQYTLWQQGKRVGNACQGVPKTCALMERFPEATGCKRGQIKFSVMQPGTHVWPHTGPTNCRLRMHLGLVIPAPGCRIRCTDQTREWEEGKVLIFDDSFEHEVWQEANSYRLIFIVDVWHPELSQYQRQTLSPI